MKRTLICLIIAVLVSGCIPGSRSLRFDSIKGEIIETDGYQISVKIIKVSDTIYDVRSSRIIDGFISTKGLNEPLLKYARLRHAAISILKSHLGQDKVITIIDDVKPPEWGHIFIRFKITETQ